MSATPTATPTRTVVRELLRRIGEGEPRRIAELYADGCDWRLDRPQDAHGRAATPWIRHRSTRADAEAHFREPAAHHVPGQADTTVERIPVDGEDAVVLGVIRQTAAPTGRAYTARFALHLTVRGGLVVRHHVYEDSLAVARAFASGDGRTLEP
ncbi:nuclear transport factor 2 family protein [Streptomyces monashensis]|uniref:Ketosteroid isomerase n=1 Tax=Streptomyces monashensis TaxID=1678012 RepID=A0A1S2QFP7_9ACTN|nr:nuclear transport factor 2 family protein [Streptomyces monashensis]OIK04165.1 ketosteroid isomerase [Streptomyces monashensis]